MNPGFAQPFTVSALSFGCWLNSKGGSIDIARDNVSNCHCQLLLWAG